MFAVNCLKNKRKQNAVKIVSSTVPIYVRQMIVFVLQVYLRCVCFKAVEQPNSMKSCNSTTEPNNIYKYIIF